MNVVHQHANVKVRLSNGSMERTGASHGRRPAPHCPGHTDIRSTPNRSLQRTTDLLDRPGSGRHNRPHTALATWLIGCEPPATTVNRRRNNEAPKLLEGRVGRHADHDSLRSDVETLRLAQGESSWRRFQKLGRMLSLQT